ncbi:MAG: translation initiation factor IF-2 [Treponema sp.]|nr:translation initiation factor IF-2 [Treponema sp.]
MTDEEQKKPKVILHKKNTEASPAKENNAGSSKESSAAGNNSNNSSSSSNSASRKKVVVVKKRNNSEREQGVQSNNKSQPVSKTNENQKSDSKTEKSAAKSEQSARSGLQPTYQSHIVARAQSSTTFELNSARPNVKAGNLSDRPRGRYNNGGYNRNGGQGGYNRNGGQGGSYNRNGGQGGYNRNGGNFTGTQAREGYQSRNNGGQGGSYNRNGGQSGGYNRNGGQGGFNRNGGQGGFNRNGGQGGFNRNGGQGGFNRNGGQGGRPGFGSGRSSYAPPAPIENKGPAKKTFKGKKQVYSRKDKEELFGEEQLYTKKKEQTPASVVPKQIDIMETISVSDLARKMNLKASEVIGKLMSLGMMVTINQSIDHETAEIVASEYNCQVHLISLYDETVIESDKGTEEGTKIRPPVVTVMGHVDHGKTKTLDAIRHTNVAAGEAGGITQAIGAYQVSTDKGVITFLDTPGHEAFTMMRARGAQITDIVVLVVAADDGVMPQTLEAVNHAKDAKVPIIVAVNKIDKPEANPERVMTQLSELGLTPEEWGGETQYVNISALKHEGIDDLLDAILLQAEMLELKAPYDCRAEGKIIESRIDQGRGVVASVIVQRGTLRTGDPFVAGVYSGRVRAMFNDKGQRVSEASPSMPVEVLGIESMPNAGDPFQVTESEKAAREISVKRQELKRFEDAKAVKKVTLDNLYSTIEQSEVKELKVIIKADLQGSAEALKSSLEKLSTRDIRLVVIHSSAGAINESDVTLAAADDNAIIVGFNVRPTPKAKALADKEKVEIRKYNIIYKCVEEITAAMEGMLKPDTKEQVTGSVEVRNTFKVPKIGIIAGCYVLDGVVKRSSSVNLIRDGIVKFTGKISSLKRFKDDAKEVNAGFECGIGLENWQDIQVGDTLEIFEYIEVARKLGDSLVDEKAAAEKAAAEKTDSASGDAN